MSKTLKTEDWTRIQESFDEMKKRFPHASDPEELPTYRLTSIKGIKEQIEERSVGEVVFYMDYLTGDTPKISKSEIIEE